MAAKPVWAYLKPCPFCGKLPAEIAYANRLAEALKHAEEWLDWEGCDCGVMPDPPCALCEARAVLREHEERRK